MRENAYYSRIKGLHGVCNFILRPGDPRIRTPSLPLLATSEWARRRSARPSPPCNSAAAAVIWAESGNADRMAEGRMDAFGALKATNASFLLFLKLGKREKLALVRRKRCRVYVWGAGSLCSGQMSNLDKPRKPARSENEISRESFSWKCMCSTVRMPCIKIKKMLRDKRKINGKCYVVARPVVHKGTTCIIPRIIFLGLEKAFALGSCSFVNKYWEIVVVIETSPVLTA